MPLVQVRRSPVLAFKTSYEDIQSTIGRLSEIWPLDAIRQARHITAKINLCDARTPETGATIDPRFLDALLGWVRLQNSSARISLTESDGISVLADRYRKWFGIDEILSRWDAGWINLSHEPEVLVPVNGRYLHEVPVARVLLESCLLSISKLKTNLLSTVTCALKNQFGCLGRIDKFKLHAHLSSVISDINLAIRPAAFIVDGVVGHGGIQGPSFGTPIRADVVLAGLDPVALDVACCNVLGYRALTIGHIRKSWMSGRGSIRYELRGDPLPQIDFENHGFEIQVFRLGGKIKRLYQRIDRPEHA
jgi:uncharacterized protein (DUF362 family)